MNTFIYALKEPDTGEIRYIGKSNNPEKRFYAHIDKRQNKTHKFCWIQSLKSRGLRPILEILDEVSLDYWEQWEVAYIEFFREQGCRLVNGTLGGDGIGVPSEDTRKKMSESAKGKPGFWTGKKMSLEARKKMSVAKAGENSPMFGKEHSQETREKISAANTGKKRSQETREKISAAKIGIKLSQETREKMSDAVCIRWSKVSDEQRVEMKTGSKNPFYGRRHSEETKRKVGLASQSRHSVEGREKLAQAAKLYHEKKRQEAYLAEMWGGESNLFGGGGD